MYEDTYLTGQTYSGNGRGYGLANSYGPIRPDMERFYTVSSAAYLNMDKKASSWQCFCTAPTCRPGLCGGSGVCAQCDACAEFNGGCPYLAKCTTAGMFNKCDCPAGYESSQIADPTAPWTCLGFPFVLVNFTT